jgi:hypothetical protein
MATYTVVVDTGDAGQDEVLEQLQELPSVIVVQFMGPGALVDTYPYVVRVDDEEMARVYQINLPDEECVFTGTPEEADAWRQAQQAPTGPPRKVAFDIDDLCSEIDAAATDEAGRGDRANPYNMAARLRDMALLRWDGQQRKVVPGG